MRFIQISILNVCVFYAASNAEITRQIRLRLVGISQLSIEQMEQCETEALSKTRPG